MSESAGRFDGIRRLYGDSDFAHLREAHFCVIGVGGVGSWVVEALARTGIGKITLIDHDDIAESNINRQLHTLSSTLGASKVETMAQRVAEIHPDCDCRAIDDFLSDNNMPHYLTADMDFVIDAIDNIRFKAAMIYYCKRNKIPIITTGGAGGLTKTSLIQIADLSKTYNDPLAAKVRSRLRSDYGFSKNSKRRFAVECVFSSEQQRYPKADGSVSHAKPGVKGASLDCNFGYGSASFITASFGFAAVSRAIEKFLEKKQR